VYPAYSVFFCVKPVGQAPATSTPCSTRPVLHRITRFYRGKHGFEANKTVLQRITLKRPPAGRLPQRLHPAALRRFYRELHGFTENNTVLQRITLNRPPAGRLPQRLHPAALRRRRRRRRRRLRCRSVTWKQTGQAMYALQAVHALLMLLMSRYARDGAMVCT
jgi:hypothetical protein